MPNQAHPEYVEWLLREARGINPISARIARRELERIYNDEKKEEVLEDIRVVKDA